MTDKSEFSKTEIISAFKPIFNCLTHDFVNPLNYSMGALTILTDMYDDLSDTERKEAIKDCLKGVNIISEMVTYLSARSEGKTVDVCDVDIKSVSMNAFSLANEEVKKSSNSFFSEDESLIMNLDGTGLLIVLLNLMKNSIEAANGQSNEISVVGRIIDDKNIIDFRDSGPGIPENLMESLFDFGVSSHGENRGSGMYIVYNFCKIMGGEIEVLPSNSGVHFRITLPA